MTYLIILLIVIVIFFFYFFLNYLFNQFTWNKIERLNQNEEIGRYSCYIDNNGYLRWKNNNKLVHRDIAWRNRKFGDHNEYTTELHVHHINRNKLDNRQENLQYLTEEEHWKTHNILSRNGKIYRKIARRYNQKQSKRAILIRGKWVPKSLIEENYGDLFVEMWYYNKYFSNNK